MKIPKPHDTEEDESLNDQMSKLTKNEKKQPVADGKPKLLGGSPEKSLSPDKLLKTHSSSKKKQNSSP